jgi:CheY-like chemotaxis protein
VLAEELLSRAEAPAEAGGRPAAKEAHTAPSARSKKGPSAKPAGGARSAKSKTAGVPAARPASVVAKRLLVVDDDPDSLALVTRALESGGYDVTVASDGASALVELGGSRFDLVVADIAMPMLDGFALVTVMADKGIDVPVIFLTGSDTPEDEARGLTLGAVDYIRKPARQDVLLARVGRVLGASPGIAGG